MQTIAEPKVLIAKILGKQRVEMDKTYRLMRYVLRVEHNGKVLLHNVVTGQLIVLGTDEVTCLDILPT